jgi:deoxyribonuclease IV
VHGGHLGVDEDSAKGFDNWRKCIDGLDLTVPLLIENTAGGDNAMARRLEAIGRLWDAISPASGIENVGFCLDTCHAFAGGLDLGSVVDDIRAVTGRIDLVHANDSRDEAGSGADRHTNFGSGTLDGAAVAALVRAAGAPVVCETPGGLEGQTADITWLRSQVD